VSGSLNNHSATADAAVRVAHMPMAVWVKETIRELSGSGAFERRVKRVLHVVRIGYAAVELQEPVLRRP
jgi:hypothetical protein